MTLILCYELFDQEHWDNNEWIAAEAVAEHFQMTFSECLKQFGFARTAEWEPEPLDGQRIRCYFRKHKEG